MLLQLSNIEKRYAGVGSARAPAPGVCVLRDVNLEVEEGEALAIVGPSGSGKSTLLNIIGTLDKPTAGRVILAGRDVSGLGEIELAKVRNSEIGWVFQLHHLLPQLSVLENVLMPTLAFRQEAGVNEQAVKRAGELLERVGLKERASHRPGQLSGGERQRAAVVRALINKPKLLVADEPTGALDQHTAGEMAQLLLDLNRDQKVTLIVVTHSRDLVGRLKRVMELRDGCLVKQE